MSALTERAVAHASSNRMHVHRERSEGRIQLLPSGCMIAREAKLLSVRANRTAQSRTTHYAYDSYGALEENSDVIIKNQSLRVIKAQIFHRRC